MTFFLPQKNTRFAIASSYRVSTPPLSEGG